MTLTPTQLYLKNLKGEIPSYMRREYRSKEQALEMLRAMTGQDFGFDVQRWEEWIGAQEAAGVVFRIPKDK
jgi:hypothetical protein